MTYFPSQQFSLNFQLQHICQLDDVLKHDCFAHIDQEMIDMMMDQTARFCEEKLLPLAASGDADGCSLEHDKVSLPEGTREAYQQWCELGFPTLSLPLERDGLSFPLCVQSAVQELIDGTNLAFGMMSINLRCAAMTLIKHAPEQLVSQWLPEFVEGSSASTIAISEPQAGSDAGRILTKATPTEGDSWLVSGSKIWISYGDQDATDNILHMVLAKTPGEEIGTRSLGLFAIPKLIDGDQNGIKITRLEEKMGLHASPTCVMELNNAKATLIGKAGEGIKNLFSMMNAMRLSVAVQGAAAANAGTLQAISYANERPQGGRPDQSPLMISQHEDVKRMLLTMTAVSELLRAMALRTAWYLDNAEIAASNGDTEESMNLTRIAELILPVAKTLGAELGHEVVNQGIQVMGGYGYTSDYPLERMARDIRVSSIYEGTSGIQALDLVKRKIVSDEGRTLRLILQTILHTIESASDNNPLKQPSLSIHSIVNSQLERVITLANNGDKKSIETGAYPMLRLCGLLFMCWNGITLYEASSQDGSDYEQRLRAALELYAQGLTEEASSWAAKSAISKIEYNFQ